MEESMKKLNLALRTEATLIGVNLLILCMSVFFIDIDLASLLLFVSIWSVTTFTFLIYGPTLLERSFGMVIAIILGIILVDNVQTFLLCYMGILVAIGVDSTIDRKTSRSYYKISAKVIKSVTPLHKIYITYEPNDLKDGLYVFKGEIIEVLKDDNLTIFLSKVKIEPNIYLLYLTTPSKFKESKLLFGGKKGIKYFNPINIDETTPLQV